MRLCDSCIHLHGVHMHAFHGVLPQEQLTGNDYEINLSLKYDVAQAMQTDEVGDTLNYAEVFQVLREEMNRPQKLLEKVVGNIGKHLFNRFPAILEIHLELIKLNPPMGADCQGAGVEVHLINDKT